MKELSGACYEEKKYGYETNDADASRLPPRTAIGRAKRRSGRNSIAGSSAKECVSALRMDNGQLLMLPNAMIFTRWTTSRSSILRERWTNSPRAVNFPSFLASVVKNSVVGAEVSLA